MSTAIYIKTALVISSFVTLASFDTMPNQVVALRGDTYVYICTGPKSERYHKTSKCKGLDSCSKKVEKVTVAKARSIGRTPCKMCYGNKYYKTR